MNKVLKWILAGVGVVVVLVVIATVVLPIVVDPNNYKEEIRTAVLEETGRELIIGGDIEWTVFPSIGLDLSNLELGNRSGFGDQPMLKIGSAGISMKLIPLFSRKVEIDKISLTDVSAYLHRKANGQNNWEDLSGSQTESSSTSISGGGDLASLVVSGLEISNANVTWNDAGEIIELKSFDLKASNIELGRPFDLEGVFSINLASSQLSGEVKFGGLVQSEADGASYGIEGLYFSFEGAQGPVGESMPLTMSINANAKLDLSKDQATLSDFVFRFHDVVVNGELKVENFDSPKLGFNFQIDYLNLDNYLPEIQEGSQGDVAETDLTVDDFRGFTGGGNFSIGELVVAGLKATNVSLKMTGNGKGIRLFPISAQFYGGQHKGDIKIDASGKRPILITSQELTGVQAEGLLQDLTGSAQLQGTGDFSLNIRTDLTNSLTTRQAMSGDMAMRFLDGAIVGINIAETIRSAKSFLGKQEESAGASGQNLKTDFSELSMTGVIKQGIFRSDDLMMRSPLLRVTGEGSANLVEETIDYLVKPTLVGSLEGQGGKGLEELKGIPIPVRLTGNLYEPDISVDIVAAVTGAQKEELIGKLLGGGDDSQTDGNQGDASEKADPVGSLLDGVFGSKKDKKKKKKKDGNGE